MPADQWPGDGRTSQERWNGMTASQQHGYVMRLERAVLDMGKATGTLRGRLREAEEELEALRSQVLACLPERGA